MKAAERVLELDAEDVSAHDLLAHAYTELSAPLPAIQPPAEVAADWIVEQAAMAADAKHPAPQRVEACANLAAGLPKLAPPRLATIREVLAKLRPAYHAEGNTEVKAALAAALAQYHRESHAIYKPDDIARAQRDAHLPGKSPGGELRCRGSRHLPDAAGAPRYDCQDRRIAAPQVSRQIWDRPPGLSAVSPDCRRGELLMSQEDAITPPAPPTDAGTGGSSSRSLLFVVTVIAIASLTVGGGYFVYKWLRKPSAETVSRPPGTARERQVREVPAITFTDVTPASGVRFHHENGYSGYKLLPETMGGGVACFDFDGDGKTDILFVGGRKWPGFLEKDGDMPRAADSCRLYRNLGDMKFEDVTDKAGLNVVLYGMGVAIGDYDNDGWPDIFVSCVGKNHLFRNA